jgi:hypothetical protein
MEKLSHWKINSSGELVTKSDLFQLWISGIYLNKHTNELDPFCEKMEKIKKRKN